METQITKSYIVKWLMCGIFAYFGINLITEFIQAIFQLIFAFLKPSILINALVYGFFGIAKIAILIIVFYHLIKNPALPSQKTVNKYLLIGVIIYGVLFLINTGLQFLNTAILSRTLGPQDFGQLSLYKNYTSYGLIFLNTITIAILGIIALVSGKNPQLADQSLTSHSA